MIWITFVLAIATILVSILWKPDRDNAEENEIKAKKIVHIVLMTVTFVLLFFSFVTFIGSGHVGVKVLFGKVNTETYLAEGAHFINPFVKAREMSVRTLSYTMSSKSNEGKKSGDDGLDVISADALTLTVEVSVLYQLTPSAASWVYKKSIMRPSIRSALRNGFAPYTAQEAYSTKRQQVQAFCEKELIASIQELVRSKGYAGTPIDVQQVLIRDIQLPTSVKQSIEAKISAEQEAMKMDFVIQKEKKEAERKAVEAEGIKNFQIIVSQGINESLLKWKGIEATEKLANSQNAKVVVIGSGKDGLPIILNDK
jgi:regulator of protease activity HflC (stomatin/prohibitin superfamily)